jgi:hypothetical protein
VLSFLIHEVGHCLVAWCHGCPAIPTLAKEYLLGPLPSGAQNAVSLGGIAGSIAAWVGAVCWFCRQPDSTRSALLAGATTGPGFYSLDSIGLPLFGPSAGLAGQNVMSYLVR